MRNNAKRILKDKFIQVNFKRTLKAPSQGSSSTVVVPVPAITSEPEPPTSPTPLRSADYIRADLLHFPQPYCNPPWLDASGFAPMILARAFLFYATSLT
jgi:hypothetical protein